MIRGLRHTGIVVTDIQKALSFYRDLLGLRVKKDKVETGSYIAKVTGIKNVNLRTVKLSAGDGNMVELLYFFCKKKKSFARRTIFDIGISHIAFTVEDLDNEYKKLLQAGIQFNSPPQLSPDGYAKVAFCRDPEGNLLELSEPLSK